MSTIKVNNLQNASGGSNSTPEEIRQGRAKVWVNFNGTGTVAIRDDFNVSSVTDLGTGDFQINFTNSLSNSNYCFTGCIGYYAVLGGMINPYNATTSSVRMESLRQNAWGTGDYEENNVALFAD